MRLAVILPCAIALAALFTYHRWCPPLFGGWYRTGWAGRMFFLTRAGADRYGSRGLSRVDPYRDGLSGPLVFQPGLLARRRPPLTRAYGRRNAAVAATS